MDAIVPAFNEEQTVALVVEALYPCFNRVIVVDDGSTDGTAAAARAAGAHVVSSANQGKAQAMRLGLRYTNSDPVAFFDADLIGLRPEHAWAMIEHQAMGFDMVCGMRDYGTIGALWQYVFGPIITGERVVRRWVLDAVDERCWNGYGIEWGMNIAASKGKIALVPLPGLFLRGKCEKVGKIEGLRQHWDMARHILKVRKDLLRGVA